MAEFTKTANEPIAPCLCGASPRISHCPSGKFRVDCRTCGRTSAIKPYRYDAVTIWNKEVRMIRMFLNSSDLLAELRDSLPKAGVFNCMRNQIDDLLRATK